MTTKDKIVFIICTALMVAGNLRTEWGVTWHCPWWHHLTFHFVHGNIFHIFGNILVLWLYCKSGKLRVKDWLTAFAIATAFSFAIPSPTPLVGFSGILMYLYGILIPPIWKNRQVRIATYIFIALSVGSLFFNQWPAVVFHALCTLAGVLCYHTQRLIHDIKDHEERTNRRGTGA